MAKPLTVAEKKDLAYQLYLHTDLFQKEIAVRVGITEKTLSKWAEVNEWETQKTALTVTGKNLIISYYNQLNALNKCIQSRDDRKFATLEEADIIAKIKSAIQAIDKKMDLPVYIEVFQEFTNYLKDLDLKQAQGIIDHFTAFLQIKTRELRNR
jgi:hypothetical protein